MGLVSFCPTCLEKPLLHIRIQMPQPSPQQAPGSLTGPGRFILVWLARVPLLTGPPAKLKAVTSLMDKLSQDLQTINLLPHRQWQP